MPDYSKGKVYRLVIDEDPSLVYYGSTIQPLCERLAKHKHDFTRDSDITSKMLFATGHKVKIFLVETFPCASKEELKARERWWIENNDCVNERIPGRTRQEHYTDNKESIQEYKKQYYKEHKEQEKARVNAWVQENREHVREYHAQHYQEKKQEYSENAKARHAANPEKARERARQYHQKNRDAILARGQEKVVCGCGKEVSRCSLPYHKKTKKHQEWLKSPQARSGSSSCVCAPLSSPGI